MLSKSKKETISSLDQKRNVIHSKTGGWIPGTGVFSHGYSMLDELVGEKTYFQIMILNATGKLAEKPLADWVEAIYGCLSWPDPRIWCNQIGALAGVARTSVVAGTTAGILAADSRSYGMYTLIEGTQLIQKCYKQHTNGLSVKNIINLVIESNKGKPNFMGYIRPIAKGDERLERMEVISQKLGFDEGMHLQLAYQIERELQDRFNEGMNINGYISAFLSDQGFTSQEVYQIFSTLVMSGVTACHLEQNNKEPDFFLPLRCNDINYTGHSQRHIEIKK
ncbi:MAG: citrate synthase [Cellvibrionaceae bacterium]|jgi:citrate synthase